MIMHNFTGVGRIKSVVFQHDPYTCHVVVSDRKALARLNAARANDTVHWGRYSARVASAVLADKKSSPVCPHC